MSKTLAVKTENLTKTFLGNEVVKNCNISVERGTIYGLFRAKWGGKDNYF